MILRSDEDDEGEAEAEGEEGKEAGYIFGAINDDELDHASCTTMTASVAANTAPSPTRTRGVFGSYKQQVTDKLRSCAERSRRHISRAILGPLQK